MVTGTTGAAGSSSKASGRSGCRRSNRGARSTLPRLSVTGLDSVSFSERLLAEERVAVVPGSAFGVHGEGYVRACYASSYEQIERALERIGRFVQRNRRD